MKNTCTAIASEGGQIHFVIKKGEKGYAAFSKILTDINQQKGALIWYGDIEDENGKEQSGLKIASNDATQEEVLSIIKDRIDSVDAELRALDKEDEKLRMTTAIFHLSKVKEEIEEYFETEETLPKYNRI